MPCFFPLAGYYAKEVNPTGRRSIVFDKRKSHSGVRIQIPCGECIGCRMVEARNWAVRCVHEKRLHDSSAFVTLTYDDKHLPAGGTLVKDHLQRFMKRLRKSRGDGIRFFACGEYGTSSFRPHYHLLLFGLDFPDRRKVGATASGDNLYRSAALESLWPAGSNIIGEVTFSSCSYVAKYCVKKAGAKPMPDGYEPEFRLMSRRPGIGSGYFDRYKSDVYRDDYVIMDAKPIPVPRFYDKKLEKLDAKLLDRVQRDRRLRAFAVRGDNTHARRVVKERFEILKSKHFARDLV